MLYHIYHDGTTEEWHVGKPVQRARHALIVSRLTEVQADGDELAYIQNHFKNIPHTDGRVCRWFGDMARFIMANL